MTLANKITLARIGLIPVFVVLAFHYGGSRDAGHPQLGLRYAAVLVFLVSAASDGLDGFIARRFNQRSRLGTILDPLADKGLLLAGVLTLTFSEWEYGFPLWFPLLVVARDLVIVLGSVALHLKNGHVHVRPRWTGKTATVLQMSAIAAVMLHLPGIKPGPFVVAAGLFTAVSGLGYILDGIRQVRVPPPRPDSPPSQQPLASPLADLASSASGHEHL